MTALGKVAGSMLKDNLVRNGVDLILDSNLMYWDMVNRRVGINTTMPGNTFVANGNATISNIYINGGNVTSLTGNLVLQSLTGNINVSNKQIKNVNEPSDDKDAATKYYVDNSNKRDLTLTFSDGVLNDNVSLATQVLTFSNTAYQIDTLLSNNMITFSLAQSIKNIGNITVNSNVTANTLTVNNATISSNLTVSNANILSSLITTGNVTIGNLFIRNNTITVLNKDGNVNLIANGNGVINTNTFTALTLPTGNNLNRPASPSVGMFRYNTAQTAVEVYDGDGWQVINTQPTVIVSDKFVGNNVTQTFTLTQPSTTGGAFVTINGVLQIPDVSYSISGNVLTFTEVPISSDIIEARLITSTVSIQDMIVGDSAIHFDRPENNYAILFDVNMQRRMTVDVANTTVHNNLVVTDGIKWANNAIYNPSITVASPPATSKGISSDIQGMIAVDSNNIYYCINTYTDGVDDIWVKSPWVTTGTWP